MTSRLPPSPSQRGYPELGNKHNLGAEKRENLGIRFFGKTTCDRLDLLTYLSA